MSFFSEGIEVEKTFSKLLTNVKFSNPQQDIDEHWDIEADYNDERKKFDIKGIKKQSREDLFYDENFHWIELSSVNGGKRSGSLYGKADYFVFEIIDYWIIVEKLKLQKFIEEKCKGQKIQDKKNPYCLYRRKGRKDIIVKVKTLDLFYINDKIIKK